MPYLILLIFLIVGVAGYLYVYNNQDRFTRDEPEQNEPDEIIYLSGPVEDTPREEDDDNDDADEQTY